MSIILDKNCNNCKHSYAFGLGYLNCRNKNRGVVLGVKSRAMILEVNVNKEPCKKWEKGIDSVSISESPF